MKKSTTLNRSKFHVSVAAAVVSLAAYSGLALADDHLNITLVGTEETPPVMTPATGTGDITVKSDKSVNGVVTIRGFAGTMAHIHQGAIGKSGPPLITLTKTGEDSWKVPDGAKLTDDQFKAYKAGDLYVNVHSSQHPAGEVRGQLKQP